MKIFSEKLLEAKKLINKQCWTSVDVAMPEGNWL